MPDETTAVTEAREAAWRELIKTRGVTLLDTVAGKAWFDAGWVAAAAVRAEERAPVYPHTWRDEDVCAVCQHLGEFHYCEREPEPGTCDDDWCSTCSDMQLAAMMHAFSPQRAEERPLEWLHPDAEWREIVREESAESMTEAEIAAYEARVEEMIRYLARLTPPTIAMLIIDANDALAGAPSEPSEQDIERAAEAICAAFQATTGSVTKPSDWREMARAALQAVRRAT